MEDREYALGVSYFYHIEPGGSFFDSILPRNLQNSQLTQRMNRTIRSRRGILHPYSPATRVSELREPRPRAVERIHKAHVHVAQWLQGCCNPCKVLKIGLVLEHVSIPSSR